MAESEGFKAIVNQVAVHTVTAVMMALSGADVGTGAATTASLREP